MFYPGSLTSNIQFTEIMYHPPGGDAFEFVELTNFGPIAMDLSRYSLRGISYEFAPEISLESGGTLLLASDQNPATFQLRYPDVQVWGYFAGSLSNSGESLVLEDSMGRYVSGLFYGDQGAWPPLADGAGYSLELLSSHRDHATPSHWWQSRNLGGSPGLYLGSEQPASDLIISEVVAANGSIVKGLGVFPDWIELENRGNALLDLGGYLLRDESSRPDYVFEEGTMLAPDERLVIWQEIPDANLTGFSFGLDREGDSVLLLDPQGARIDAVSFGQQLLDYSLSRGESSEWFLGEFSPGESNQRVMVAPLVGNLRINELMANPLPGETDWLEIYNTDSAQQMALDGLHLRLNEHVVGLAPHSFVEPNGYRVLYSVDETHREALRFRIPSEGAELSLLDEKGDLIDQVSFRAQAEGSSLGRLPNGSGGFQSFDNHSTPGKENVEKNQPTLAINEVMARNQSVVYAGIEGTPDWIELVNVTGSRVDIGGMGVRLEGGGEWAFPDGIQIDNGGFLIVWFDGD